MTRRGARGRKWSARVRVQPGALHGWQEHSTETERHAAIERSIRADGYATTIRRLDFIANVANRLDNMALHRTARSDLEWAEMEHSEGDVVREGDGRYHRVSAFTTRRGKRVPTHLARNPRR